MHSQIRFKNLIDSIQRGNGRSESILLIGAIRIIIVTPISSVFPSASHGNTKCFKRSEIPFSDSVHLFIRFISNNIRFQFRLTNKAACKTILLSLIGQVLTIFFRLDKITFSFSIPNPCTNPFGSKRNSCRNPFSLATHPCVGLNIWIFLSHCRRQYTRWLKAKTFKQSFFVRQLYHFQKTIFRIV